MIDLAQKYANDGFLIFPDPVLPPDTVSRARSGMDAIRRGEYDRGTPPQASPWNPGDSEHTLCKIEQPQFANQAVLDLISHQKIGELAGRATDAEWIQVWWVQLLYKPVGAETEENRINIGWHQGLTRYIDDKTICPVIYRRE